MSDFSKYICNKEPRFRYMLLSRMQSDCEYYLGNGRIFGPHLWAGNEKDQIEDMKILWNSFPDDQKPEWLSYEDILAFERRLNPHYKQQQDELDRIAKQLDITLFRPEIHLNPYDTNTVSFHKRKKDHKDFKHPFFIFENTDANGDFSYEYACRGQFDLRSDCWSANLIEHLKRLCNPVARIDYLYRSGEIGESLYFYCEEDFLKRFKEDNYYGSPMTVTLYRDGNGNTISTAFLLDTDPPIQGFSIENHYEAKEVKQK